MINKQIIKKETQIILLGHLTLGMIMQIIFILVHKFGLRSLTSNLVSSSVSILNFYLMSLSIDKSLSMKNTEESKRFMKASYSLRLLLTGIVIIVCASQSAYFDLYALLIPLLFTRLTVTLRTLGMTDLRKSTEAHDEE